MTLAELIAQLRDQMVQQLEERNANSARLAELRGAENVDEAEVTRLRAENTRIDAEIDQRQARAAELEAEQARDDAMTRLSTELHPTGATTAQRGYDQQHRIGAEPRTYTQENDPRGVNFLRDLGLDFMFHDRGAGERLSRHMAEERVERGAAIEAQATRAAGTEQRATGTGAFSGLTVPQYLTDLVAPLARPGRPFADACRHHDLPASGMVVNISRITTGSSNALVAENANTSETDMDDTLLSIAVQDAAGQQTVSRAAIERGTGIEDTTLEDMMRAYNANIDAILLTQAATGMTNVATAVAYTDATPTAAELYPKLLAAPAGVEAALLDADPGDTIAVMHSRRWYWLQSQLSSTWPLFGQPSVPAQLSGVNYGEKYGSGFRGILPSGTPVIVDNNTPTNLGAGTNEDEIYFAAQSECHLWEDPNAPVLIRAEQPKAAALGVLFVVYGYFAYTLARYAHAQKIGGTGLVTPVFA